MVKFPLYSFQGLVEAFYKGVSVVDAGGKADGVFVDAESGAALGW